MSRASIPSDPDRPARDLIKYLPGSVQLNDEDSYRLFSKLVESDKNYDTSSGLAEGLNYTKDQLPPILSSLMEYYDIERENWQWGSSNQWNMSGLKDEAGDDLEDAAELLNPEEA